MSRSIAAYRAFLTGIFRFSALAFCGLTLSPTLAAGDQPAEATRQLFDLGWSANIADRSAVDSFVDRTPTAVKTPLFHYAYCLVLMKQRRYSLATANLQMLVRIDRSDLAAWKALTWLRVLTQNYRQALAELDQMSQVVAGNLYDKKGRGKKLPAVQLKANLIAVRSLAGLLAFLDFPVADAVPVALRNEFRNRITARFQGQGLAAFREAQQEVIDLHNQFQRKIAGESRLAQQQGARQRQQDLRDLDDIKRRIRNRKDNLRDDQEDMAKRVNKRRTQLNEQARPLQSRLSTLELLSGQTFVDQNRVSLDLSRLYRQLRRSRDPIIRNSILRDVQNLENLMANYEFQRWQINREAGSVLLKRDHLAAELQDIERGVSQQARREMKELSQLDRRERRADSQSRKLLDKRPSASRRVRGLVAKARALPTFALFALELEKQRVLAIKP